MTKQSYLSCCLFALFAAAADAQVTSSSTPPPADAAASAAPSDTAASDETVKLPAFGVSATPTDRYRAVDATSVARIAGSILDSPLTVNVVTSAEIQDLGADAIYDVTKYFAGMSPGRGSGMGGISDRETFRGFESTGKTIDSFSEFAVPTEVGFQATLDPYLIDHAELVMGPDSILSPTGTPGGSVNVITKSPQFNPSTEIMGEVGNYGANKVGFDTTGPIGDGKHMAFRLIADYQDANTYVPGDVKVWTGSAQFTYKFTDTAKITVKYIGEQSAEQGEVANSNDNGEIVYAPYTVNGATLSNTPQPGFGYNSANGSAAWSSRIDRFNIGSAELTAALTDNINMRFGVQILNDSLNYVAGYPSSSPSDTYNAATGQAIGISGITGIPTAIPEIGNYTQVRNQDLQIQNDYAGNFKLNGISLQPVAGWSYEHGIQPLDYVVQDKTTLPTANALVPYAAPMPALTQFNSLSLNAAGSNGTIIRGYGLLRAGFFHDRLYLTGGVGRTWAKANDFTWTGIYQGGFGNVGSATPVVTDHTFGNTGSAVAPSGQDFHDTYMAGALFKILSNVSAYYSFSTNAGIAASNPVWQAGRQNEFGLKTEFFDQRISISADHFEIKESNVSSTNPLFAVGLSPFNTILADETSEGYEVNIVGGITRDLSIIASFTDMKLRDAAGRRVRNVPDLEANLLLNYHIPERWVKGVTLYAGVQHTGNTAGENSPNLGFTSQGAVDQVAYYIPPWTVVNAGGSYRWRNYSVNLNIDNALDTEFFWQASGRASLAPYPALTYRLTFKIKI